MQYNNTARNDDRAKNGEFKIKKYLLEHAVVRFLWKCEFWKGYVVSWWSNIFQVKYLPSYNSAVSFKPNGTRCIFLYNMEKNKI